MLKQIQLKNFAIIEKLALDLQEGMTVITGETGAGKSIMIDAIGLAIGHRASSEVVKNGCERADICLSLDIHNIPTAQQWLTQQEIDQDECLIRRVISKDGRSKCFINDIPTTLQKLKEFGELLINIHGQHEPQALFKREAQRDLLDAFAGHQLLAGEIKRLHQQWYSTKQQFDELKKNSQEAGARAEFLKYQLEELNELNLQENELEQLEQEHKRLANASELIASCQLAIGCIEENENSANNSLNQAQHALESFAEFDPSIKNAAELLNSAAIQAQEANDELRDFLDRLEADPQRLQDIEDRLSKVHDIARKHRVRPEELLALQPKLNEEFENYANCDEKLAELEEKTKQLAEEYLLKAKQLSTSREKAAKQLEKQVMQNLKQLGMPNAKFKISFEELESFSVYGLEKPEYLVNTNPGQKLQALNKIASGGELSRISLAIQVITAKKHTIPTLIFDEVDVGIGGAVAETVGELVRELSQQAQVITITHLGQVACKGHQHLQVSKSTDKQNTTVQIKPLSNKERINEIARMIGGKNISAQTLAHAEEMLN